MQPTSQAAVWDGAERRRVEAVVETIAALHSTVESLAEVAHDARNMVTALGLYCDLLEEPGVLAAPFKHYGYELRLVAAASRRLVEKLVALDAGQNAGQKAGQGTGQNAGQNAGRNGAGAAARAGLLDAGRRPVKSEPPERVRPMRRWELLPAILIDDLGAELLANRNLLAALAGPSNALTVDADSAAFPIRLTGEDLTRVLVNLVKNAAEAMSSGGRIQLSLRRRPAAPGQPESVLLTIDDTGPGIPADALERIFETGFSTQSGSAGEGSWPAARRGLGLSITRSIVEAAGGSIRALNRDPAGARLEIELPLRKH